LKRRFALVLLVLVLVICGSGYAGYTYFVGLESQNLSQGPVELRVFVAASLTTVVTENQPTFEKGDNAKLIFNAAGSDTLYSQIISGSPADVFMAADFKWLNQLKSQGLLYDDKYWNFTTNYLVVMLPADNPKNITSLLDLVKPGVRIVISGWTVPAGKYTNSTLIKIDKTWGNPASPKYKGPEWENYKARFIQNIISYETSVEQVVGKVAMGNCDAGIAYISDATTAGGSKLQLLQIPAEVNTLGVYAIGIIKSSNQHDLATKYVNFWLSSEGQDLLHKFGFGGTPSTTFSSIWTFWAAQGFLPSRDAGELAYLPGRMTQTLI
jgi:molybdate transport system substrate-binding protein